MKKIYVLLLVLSVTISVLAGSHSLAVVITYIKGETPFPELSFTFVLDDITVGHFDSEKNIFTSRGLSKTEEDDDVVDPNRIKTMSSYLHEEYKDRYHYITYNFNFTERVHVQQTLATCELMDNDTPGPLIIKNAFGGVTRDEYTFYEGKLTYQNGLNYPSERLNAFLVIEQWRQENFYCPGCIKFLRGYLKKRGNQVKRKVKPRVRLIQRRLSVSGWDGVTCLATGFYPRHINLTILRDGQPVSDHLITGGDLLPNGDGTYQMRKNLELREEELKKHNYTCRVSHLSLDNKLDVSLDLVPGEPIGPVLSSMLLILLLLVCVIGALIWIIYRRKRSASSQKEHSANSSTDGSEVSLTASSD